MWTRSCWVTCRRSWGPLMFTEWFIRHSNLDEYTGAKRELARFCIRVGVVALVLASVGAAWLLYSTPVVVELVGNVLD